MRKISEKFFRRYIVNGAIIFMFAILFSLTYIGGVSTVFSSNEYSPYYYGNREKNNVSVMINVYMGTEYIDSILNTLNEYNAKATFFVGGCWVVKNSEVVQKIIDNGHEIGNHGYFHKDHKMLSLEKNKSEMELTHKVVKELFDYDIKLFAPPSGSFGQNTLKVAQSMGYKTIMWTKDTIDWRDQDENVLYQRAINKPKGGDLILMHPTLSTSKILGKVLAFYQKEGYNLTTVYENIL